ncbi:MAG: hypothetical protein WBA62_17170 [Xanthobacteraceae bacterium]
MAKRKVKVTKKTTRSAASIKTKPGGPSKKAARRGDETHVLFGILGLTDIIHTIRTAGLENEFNQAVGDDGKFVKVSRNGMLNIHNFIQSHPALSGLAADMRECDCPPNDPYCRYFLP